MFHSAFLLNITSTAHPCGVIQHTRVQYLYLGLNDFVPPWPLENDFCLLRAKPHQNLILHRYLPRVPFFTTSLGCGRLKRKKTASRREETEKCGNFRKQTSKRIQERQWTREKVVGNQHNQNAQRLKNANHQKKNIYPSWALSTTIPVRVRKCPVGRRRNLSGIVIHPGYLR